MDGPRSAGRPAPPPCVALVLFWMLGACSAIEPRRLDEAGPRLNASGPSAIVATTARAAEVVASAAHDASIPSATRPNPCPDDMVDVGIVCIDRFEAPNEAGSKPLLMQSASDGEAFCEARDKRLCTEDEWVRACEGPHGRPVPYGERYQAGTCNDDGEGRVARWGALGTWPGAPAKSEVARLDQAEPSGARQGCVSEEGVFDLTGNAAEWVVRTKPNPTDYSHVVKGCFWGKCFRPPHSPTCEYVNYAHPYGYRSYEMSFRCCRPRRVR